jgi:hypothetical protein
MNHERSDRHRSFANNDSALAWPTSLEVAANPTVLPPANRPLVCLVNEITA